jgi:hypothetical protein
MEIRNNVAMAVVRGAENGPAPHVNDCSDWVSGHHPEKGLFMPLSFVEEDNLVSYLLNGAE